MTTELTILGWTLVLALVQILLPAMFRNQETGIAYNMSARDGAAPPPRPVTARLQRAQANLFETLPLFAAAVLVAHVPDAKAPSSCGAAGSTWARASSTFRCTRPASRCCAAWYGRFPWADWRWCWRRSWRLERCGRGRAAKAILAP